VASFLGVNLSLQESIKKFPDDKSTGSSSMNAMMFTEGAPSDYEEWVRLGAKGWGYHDIKPYLRKIEGHVLHNEHPDTTHEHRGDKGRIQTGYSYCGVSPFA
jgi:choline dehydrogenase